MITASNPRLEPPLFIALAATYLAGLIVAFLFSYTLLGGAFAPISLPPFPFPAGSPVTATAGATATENLPTPPNTVTVPAPALTTTPVETQDLASPSPTAATMAATETAYPVVTQDPTSSSPTVTALPATETTTPVETQDLASPSPTATTLPATATATATHTATPTVTATPTRKPTRKPKPTSTPLPPAPQSAFVSGVSGHPMISLLDCEARAAVDWAGFFGVSIDERDFLNKMPYSDNPEKGYVGHWWDPAGNIPPGSYGIHARPIADLLRSYGLKAQGYKKASFYDLQMELSAGHPVIVWVIGPVQPVKNGVEYTASDGEKTIVAPYEHTVLLIGYDPGSVTILDGARQYTRSIQDFKTSWAVLGNMVVTRGE